MKKKIYKVNEINENTIVSSDIINDRLKPSIIISFAHPYITLPYLKAKGLATEETLKELSEKTEIKYDQGVLFDKEGQILDENSITLNVVNDLIHNTEEALKRNDDSGIPIANLTKKIIETKVLTNLNSKNQDSVVISVEDLMTKLYDKTEVRSMSK